MPHVRHVAPLARRGGLLLVAVTSIAILAACGSTVPLGPTTSGSAAAQSPGVGGVGGLGATASAGPGGFHLPAGASGAEAATAAPQATGHAGGATVPPPSQVAAGQPVTIGFQVSENLQAGYAAVGAGGPAPDESSAVKALIAWVNHNGGLGGHPLRAVVHQTNPTSGSFASQAEAACADFTQDHHVTAVITSPSVGGSDLLAECLAQHHTIDIEENHWIYDGDYFRRLAPYLYRPGDMSADRWGGAYVDGLNNLGFFRPGARVGLVRFDSPVFARIANGVVKPRLAAHHVTLAAESTIAEPGSLSDFGSMAAAIQSTILRFRSLRVDHVMFIENAAELPFFWMPQAENENYYPAYGFTSLDQPTLEANNHPNALSGGAVGVGWEPASDVEDTNHPGGNPSWVLCKQIMAAGSVQNVQNNTWATGAFCDGLFFLRTVLSSGAAFDPAAFRAAVERVGAAYRSPLTFGPSGFTRGRYDGAEQVGYLRYAASCTCFRYSGSPHTVP